jgi:hypothetical protein
LIHKSREGIVHTLRVLRCYFCKINAVPLRKSTTILSWNSAGRRHVCFVPYQDTWNTGQTVLFDVLQKSFTLLEALQVGD